MNFLWGSRRRESGRRLSAHAGLGEVLWRTRWATHNHCTVCGMHAVANIELQQHCHMNIVISIETSDHRTAHGRPLAPRLVQGSANAHRGCTHRMAACACPTLVWCMRRGTGKTSKRQLLSRVRAVRPRHIALLGCYLAPTVTLKHVRVLATFRASARAQEDQQNNKFCLAGVPCAPGTLCVWGCYRANCHNKARMCPSHVSCKRTGTGRPGKYHQFCLACVPCAPTAGSGCRCR